MSNVEIKKVQEKILEIMCFIDEICRKNNIEYYIMGGTALGAIRHGGFIPWDDDLDIFMTPSNYERFKAIFSDLESDKLVLQEWKASRNHIQYAKIRMNGTTFIEEAFIDKKDMHHGIYVDIMILQKCPKSYTVQKRMYIASKLSTLALLAQRNWKPKNLTQSIALFIIKIIYSENLIDHLMNSIYKYKDLKEDYTYCYFMTKAKFNQGIFDKEVFEDAKDISFEGIMLKGPADIKKYLDVRYGNYMKLPSVEEQQGSVHALIYDVDIDYRNYLTD